MSREMTVQADGGSRGNPGPAGCGAVVTDTASGEVLAERAVPLGTATNNVAEYRGLVVGLETAAELGADVVDVRMDSKLVIEQMSGRWRIKDDGLKPLATRAGEIAAGFERVDYQWIPRARNERADRLANTAMDERTGVETGVAHSAAEAEERERTTAVRPTPWTGATGEPTRLLLVRHGQTAMSVERRYSGRGDVPLNAAGTEQAAAVAKRVAAMLGDGCHGAEPVPIVSSPLTRAQQTARAVVDACGGTVDTRPDLTETDFGAWEGLGFAEAAERDPETHRRWLGDSSVAPPDGESFDAVYGRVRRLCGELCTEFSGRTAVLVSHVTPIKSLLRIGLDTGPSLLYRLHLDLASLSIVEFYPDGNASVRLVNDTGHLV